MNHFSIKPGELVNCQGKILKIEVVLDSKSVLARDVSTKELDKFSIADLSKYQPEGTEGAPKKRELFWETLSDEEKALAQTRYAVIEPLLKEHRGNGAKAKSIAAEQKVHVATIYKWIEKYQEAGLASLIDRDGRGGPGKGRLPEEIEKIIQTTIEDFYFGLDNTKEATITEVISLCRNAKLPGPARNTIRARIDEIDPSDRLRKLRGNKAANQKYGATEGHLTANYPLEKVQLDHTLLKIKVVDEIHRLPLDFVWLTVPIDIFSRMPLGFQLSLDTPGAMGTGLCMAHSIFPKEAYLANLGISGEWPCWGFPKLLLVDNAKEFKGHMLKEACTSYGIDLDFRPVATPHYGGHIERLMGTFKNGLDNLPGKAARKKEDREYYKSDETAALTLRELEQIIATYIVKVYMQSFHSGINTSPIKKWTEGIFGTNNQKGTGLPDRPVDYSRLRLDFMPFTTRTVQDYGISIDCIKYFDEPLRKWINSVDPDSGKLEAKRRFIVKRDDFDFSKIYFFEPELKTYFTIRYADLNAPEMNKWEYNAVYRKLKLQNKKNIDQDMIFEGIREMRRLAETAKTVTKATRKNQSRKKKKQNTPPIKTANSVSTPSTPPSKIDKSKIKQITDLSYGSSNTRS